MNVGATKKIRPDQLTGTLAESLLEWEQENEEKFFRAIDDAADATKQRDNILHRGMVTKQASTSDILQ